MKKLKDFLEVYKPKSPDEQKFVDKHVTIKHKDRNGNGDDVFKGNTKTIKRKEERHGYDVGEDEKVYEEVEELDEKNQQYIEVVNAHTNSKSYTPVHKTKAFAALNHYRSFSHTKSARIIDQNQYDKIQAAKKDVKEEVDIDTVLDEALDLLMSIDEKTLTPAEMKKREEVVKAIKRDDPKMDKSMAYAIATKTAKKVAEGTMPTADEPTDANKKTAQKVRDLFSKEKGKWASKSYKTADGKWASKDVKEETEELDESAKIAAHLIKRYGDNVRKSHVVSAANDFGVDASKLAKAVRAKLGKTSLAEEEQIDEISTSKLTNYTAKASDASMHRGMTTAKLDKRYKGVALAHEKIRGRHAKVSATEVDEAVGDITVTKMSPADAYKKHTGQMTKKTSAPKDPKTGKTLYQKVTEEEDLDEGMAMWKVEYPKQHAGKAVAAGYVHVKAQNTAHAHKVAAKRVGVDSKMFNTKVTKSSILPEEAEKLDEISKPTMGRYINKAKDQIDAASYKQGIRDYVGQSTTAAKATERKLSKRHKGIETAVKKLTKEDAEQIDELSKGTLGKYLKRSKDEIDADSYTRGMRGERGQSGDAYDRKLERNVANRHAGSERAIKKLTKEDAEQIDELSKGTMGRYINKAATKMGSQGVTAGLKIAADEKSSKNFKDMAKREKGIKLAVGKLTKEDIINRTIDKYVPEEVKFTPEERFLKRLNGISEAHINTLMGLFEALNKDNQNKMIETVETREGINQLLNFALENRGE